MAKTPKKGTAAQARPSRPLSPVWVGIGLAAAWGALHMPETLRWMVLCGFGVKVLAIAVVAGGLTAAAMELAITLALRLPGLLAQVARR